MENALAWCFRGRSQHGILDKAFAIAFSNAMVETAAKQLQDAGAEQENRGARQTVKARKVSEFMSKDTRADALEKAWVFCKPVQLHLNRIFSCEQSRHCILRGRLALVAPSR